MTTCRTAFNLSSRTEHALNEMRHINTTISKGQPIITSGVRNARGHCSIWNASLTLLLKPLLYRSDGERREQQNTTRKAKNGEPAKSSRTGRKDLGIVSIANVILLKWRFPVNCRLWIQMWFSHSTKRKYRYENMYTENISFIACRYIQPPGR